MENEIYGVSTSGHHSCSRAVSQPLDVTPSRAGRRWGQVTEGHWWCGVLDCSAGLDGLTLPALQPHICMREREVGRQRARPCQTVEPITNILQGRGQEPILQLRQWRPSTRITRVLLIKRKEAAAFPPSPPCRFKRPDPRLSLWFCCARPLAPCPWD